jgi:membrane protein implicated in regulation of membrane protease activity
MMIAAALLILLGLYLAGGFLFAVPFVLLGVNKIDPHAAHGTWGFRLLILPGAAVFWPLLLRRWLKRVPAPPEERSPHRHAGQPHSPP